MFSCCFMLIVTGLLLAAVLIVWQPQRQQQVFFIYWVFSTVIPSLLLFMPIKLVKWVKWAELALLLFPLQIDSKRKQKNYSSKLCMKSGQLCSNPKRCIGSYFIWLYCFVKVVKSVILRCIRISRQQWK